MRYAPRAGAHGDGDRAAVHVEHEALEAALQQHEDRHRQDRRDHRVHERDGGRVDDELPRRDAQSPLLPGPVPRTPVTGIAGGDARDERAEGGDGADREPAPERRDLPGEDDQGDDSEQHGGRETGDDRLGLDAEAIGARVDAARPDGRGRVGCLWLFCGEHGTQHDAPRSCVPHHADRVNAPAAARLARRWRCRGVRSRGCPDPADRRCRGSAGPGRAGPRWGACRWMPRGRRRPLREARREPTADLP